MSRMKSTYVLALCLALMSSSCAYYAFLRAENFIRQGKFYLAIEEYVSFAQERPSHTKAPEALFEAARLQRLMLNKPEEAIKTYMALVRNFPVNDYTSRAQKALADLYKNQFANCHQAIVEYEKFLRTAPEHAEAPLARFEIAQCYARLHKHDQAMLEYEQLIREYPQYEKMDEVFFAMGSNAYIKGDYDKALKLYDALIQRYPDSVYYAQGIFGIASTYEEMDNFQNARLFYQKALPIYPSKKVVEIRLKAVESRQKRKLKG